MPASLARPSLLLLLVLLITGSACSASRPPAADAPAASGGADATISGTVRYRERIALPPGSVVTVRLEDVSRADAPATVVAETQVRPTGQVPVPFTLAYAPTRLQRGHRYTLRAQIHNAEGLLQWTTTEAFPVLAAGAPTRGLDLVLARIFVHPVTLPTEVTWRLTAFTQAGGASVALGTGRYTLRFDAERASGFADCNQFSAPYRTAAGTTLTLGPVIATRMGCPAGSAGDAYAEALGTTERFTLEQGNLVLHTRAGARLTFARTS